MKEVSWARSKPHKVSKIGPLTALLVSGPELLGTTCVDSIVQEVAKFAGAEILYPQARLAQAINVAISSALVDVVSSSAELARGVFRIKILGPYRDLELCN